MINKFSILGLGFGVLVNSSVMAAPQAWKDSESLYSTSITTQTPFSNLVKHRALALDISLLTEQLSTKSLSARSLKVAPKSPEIEIPLPQGGSVRVIAKQISIMAPELAKKFPHLKTWQVTGVDDDRITGVVDTTEQGFHAMLTMPDGDTIFIDPDKDSGKYLSFSKYENAQHFNNKFQCKVGSGSSLNYSPFSQPFQLQTQSGNKLAKSAPVNIVYDLAVATTGEYTQFHGGTVGRGLSAVITTINRVNKVLQQDTGVSLRLIAEQEYLIYTNPNTDPYTNDDVSALLDENVVNLSSAGVLHQSRFDIGHVFSTGEYAGLASVASVCDDDGNDKASGASGLSHPVGETFSLDYVAHEIGHQLGATHTFNSQCSGSGQRTGVTAVEPGSGSTIMSYAGLCGPNDLQKNVDGQFHAVSIIQISNNTRKGKGSQCGVTVNPSNQAPNISAGPDYTVPAQTPFMLVAKGSDSDGDALSYTWEQSDTGTRSNVDIDTGDNALIRSRPASHLKTRYIPRLADLFKGIGAARGERLPASDRDMHFMVTVRDGKGGIDIDETKLKISGTGRTFGVTSQNFDETLTVGDEIKVLWDVAGTNLSPIACHQVNISFIEADGTKVKISTTPNDGEKTLVIPNNIPNMSDARIMISCSNNLFFNVSSGKLKVKNSKSSSGDSGGGSGSLLLLPLLLMRLFRKKVRGVKV